MVIRKKLMIERLIFGCIKNVGDRRKINVLFVINAPPGGLLVQSNRNINRLRCRSRTTTAIRLGADKKLSMVILDLKEVCIQ